MNLRLVSRRNLPRSAGLRERVVAPARVLALLLVVAACAGCSPGTRNGDAADVPARPAGPPPDRGLAYAHASAAPGYVLFSPLVSDVTYLVDAAGKVVHTWQSQYSPCGLYLLDNGSLLRLAHEPTPSAFQAGGEAGRIQELAWDGEVVWDFVMADDERLLHHDIVPLKNGNVLAIAWERKSRDEALRRGRMPELLHDKGLWPDWVLELEPVPPREARIVWEWHSWDHLVQDHDAQAEGHGALADHPGRIDINGDRDRPELTKEEIDQLRALGYLSDDVDPKDLRPDFLHTNSIDYHPGFDQILLSVPGFDEIWVLDHSVNTADAAGSRGGRAGRGGDLLYRWGNPRIYGRGTKEQQQLGGQHNAHWIPKGLPGEGNILIFDNDASHGGKEQFSRVIEIDPPSDPNGLFPLEAGAPYGPAEPMWTYQAADKTSFSAPFISGAHRLPNGNTFVTAGPQGRLFEVTPGGDVVWEYWSPYSGNVRDPDGSLPQPIPPDGGYAIFRATKIPPGHPALAGRDLSPLDPQPAPVAPPAPDPPPGAKSDGETTGQ